jgi:hypothetical protein
MPSHNKQQQPTATADSIPEKVETLEDKFTLTESNLRHWWPIEKAKAVIEDAKRKMVQDGISERLASQVTSYEPSTEEKRAREVLRVCISDKTGRFHTIESLQQANLLSDAQADYIREEHKGLGNGRVPPYYFISQVHRVIPENNSSKSYLTANTLFEGLAVGTLESQPYRILEGDRINHSWTFGVYYLPTLVPRTVNDSDGRNKRVLEFNWREIGWNGRKVYTIPFDVDTFNTIMKHAFGPFEEGKISLSILRGGKNYGVKDIDDFLATDGTEINAIVDRWEKPANQQGQQPLFKDSKDLRDYSDFLRWKEAREKHEKKDADNHFQ